MDTSPKTMKKAILFGIRKTLLELGSATKVELRDKLDISFPTISKFLVQMEKDGEITSVGFDESSGGRRAKRYSYNPEHMLGLAIFLENTETIYTIFNCVGEVREQGKAPSVLVDKGLDLLTTTISTIMTENPKISSVAIGVPGSVDNGRIFYIPDYEHLQNFDLKEYLEDRFSIPVVVENDMNAAVLGYYQKIGNKKNKSLVYLYSGHNGPGAGIMINGEVVRGSTFFSGEVSFVPQYDNQNFGQAQKMENGPKKSLIKDGQIDAFSRLIASFVAIINPHTIIFCIDEIEIDILDKIAKGSSTYIPSEHLPKLTISDWKQDYLSGLQGLGIDHMMNESHIRKDEV
ncbi:ROK family protein [Bacillus timonensis]|uniref:ROK family protein n=1 Tax=Bacillus timonensis TaxID=1033734 RepID=A0A4S3PUG6_9BACI|nr:ROK family protein [Bacillus timonensis]THE13134.1 ROK family protein [Bacillus timonensis]